MAIANYTDLNAAIADYLARSDMDSRIPDFISLAEGRFNRSLRTRDMEASGTLTLTSGQATLPTDYLEWISATWVGTRTQDLQYAEPDGETWRRRYRPNGDPQLFSILAGKVQIRPVTTGSLSFYYYQQIPALASNATNWLLTRAPDLYLYTALAEAMVFVKDDERRNQFLQLAQNELEKAIQAGDSNKIARRSGYNAAQADEQNTANNPQ
jgi:hypothetical protein